MLLQNKTALIYGGGGAIGGAVAAVFAREGASVFLAGRTRSTLEQTATRIRDAGGSAVVDVVDVLDETEVNDHATSVSSAAGGIDVSLNAVGIAHVQGTPLAELSLAEFLQPITAYTQANFLTAKATARHMMGRGSGVILTLSTVGSQLPGPGHLGYGTTCGAIETFSRILAGEVAGSGVRVVCLRPHAIPDSVATSYVGEAFAGQARAAGTTVDNWLNAFAQHHTLLGRLPSLSDVAEYAAFVASDRAAATTGAVINLTCGALLD